MQKLFSEELTFIEKYFQFLYFLADIKTLLKVKFKIYAKILSVLFLYKVNKR